MKVNFGDAINEVLRSMGLDIDDDVDDSILNSVKLRINQIQDAIFFDRGWEWRRRKFFFTTRPPVTDGTVTVTNNSKDVSGSGTSWDDSMKVGYLRVDGRIYKISRIVSATALKLSAPYPQDDSSPETYKIVFPEYVLNPQISSILTVKNAGAILDIKTEERAIIDPSSIGSPQEAYLSGRTSEDFDNTGQVQVSKGSANVTGTGTNWSSINEGMTFRVNEFSEPYVVKEVSSTTLLTLDRNYQGDSGAGKSYKLNPTGGLILRIADIPDDTYLIEIDALIVPLKLVDNNDESLIPNHAPLLHGSTWLALADLEDRNPVRIQQARADYQRTLKQLQDSFRIVTTTRWRSQKEVALQLSRRIPRENPLDL